jgi:hypothetical protein
MKMSLRCYGRLRRVGRLLRDEMRSISNEEGKRKKKKEFGGVKLLFLMLKLSMIFLRVPQGWHHDSATK